MADPSGVPDGRLAELGGPSRTPNVPVSPWIRRSRFAGPSFAASVATASGPVAVAPRARRRGASRASGHSDSNGSGAAAGGASRMHPAGSLQLELVPLELLHREPARRSRPTSRQAGHAHDGRAGAQRPASARAGALPRSAPQFCEWCRQPLGPGNQNGRKRVYCSQSCRQRAYQSRKRSKQLGLRDGELVVSSVLLARMNKRLKALETALSEVEKAGLHMTDDRVADLCQAARRLRRLVVGPPTR